MAEQFTSYAKAIDNLNPDDAVTEGFVNPHTGEIEIETRVWNIPAGDGTLVIERNYGRKPAFEHDWWPYSVTFEDGTGGVQIGFRPTSRISDEYPVPEVVDALRQSMPPEIRADGTEEQEIDNTLQTV